MLEEGTCIKGCPLYYYSLNCSALCPESFIFVRVFLGTIISNEITEVVYYKTLVNNRRAKKFECSESDEALVGGGR